MQPVEQIDLDAGRGIVGDRYYGSTHRHVSIQSAEELAEAARVLGRDIAPHATRRNVTLGSGRLPVEPGTVLLVGAVRLEVVRRAAPCRVMDETIGPGGRAALRRRGGIICRVLSVGAIRLGDTASWPELPT